MVTTERVAQFAAETRFQDLPAEVVTAAKRAILDTIGVTIAGARQEGSRILIGSLALKGQAGDAGILGTDMRAPAAQAALANGALGHALDYDDVNISMRGHPSIPVLPAVLGIAEMAGLHGRDLLTAFVTGFEVECKLGRTLDYSSYARGWHATSVLGALGAAAACANLLRLNVGQTRHAIGIAASMASGMRQNFGTMTKPLHAGLAARAGVEAASLARHAFTADPEILEAPLGFGRLFSPDGDWRPDRLGDLGKPWDIIDPGISVKKYPCCYMTHRAIDATLAATRAEPRAEEEIESVEVRVPAGSVSALIHPRPITGLEGKFSMEYCVAEALLGGSVSLDSFEDVEVARPQAQALLRRVAVVEAPRRDTPASGTTHVTLQLADGDSLGAAVDCARGDPADPLSWDELVEKFRDCAGRGLPPSGIDECVGLIERLEETPVSELARALTSPEQRPRPRPGSPGGHEGPGGSR